MPLASVVVLISESSGAVVIAVPPVVFMFETLADIVLAFVIAFVFAIVVLLVLVFVVSVQPAANTASDSVNRLSVNLFFNF